MHERILISGSGGQGILFIGRLLAQAALDNISFITFFPAYGAEIRGGTCYCQVILSSDEIASPTAETFDSMIIMNQQSADRFLGQLDKHGSAIINESLCHDDKHERYTCVRATEIADQAGNPKTANLVMIGALLARKPLMPVENVEKALAMSLTGGKKALLDVNLQAFHIGLES